MHNLRVPYRKAERETLRGHKFINHHSQIITHKSLRPLNPHTHAFYSNKWVNPHILRYFKSVLSGFGENGILLYLHLHIAVIAPFGRSILSECVPLRSTMFCSLRLLYSCSPAPHVFQLAMLVYAYMLHI